MMISEPTATYFEATHNEIRLAILSDNRPGRSGLDTEHGLSIYMEGPSGRFLLDTGASDLFVRNAKKMGIDLGEVDYCLLSHGHYDHIGGLPSFLDLNSTAKIVLSSRIPGAEYLSVKGKPHSITGNVDFRKHRGRFIFIDKSCTLGNIHIYSDLQTNNPLPKGNRNLLIREAGTEAVPDTFRHELAFVIDGVLFTGCAHNGIMNILHSVQESVTCCIGGFHLLDSDGEKEYETDDELRQIAKELRSEYPETAFYTGHCTGDRSFRTLSDAMQGVLHQFHCGQRLTLDSPESFV
jgi:7,8-dihydropterin-6-yl-methyl-4-(beta-D-ribofuranosyl)aminobenzene 5'-phosphate synthase